MTRPTLLHVAPFSPLSPNSGGRARLAATVDFLSRDWNIVGVYIEPDAKRLMAATHLPTSKGVVMAGEKRERFRSPHRKWEDRLRRLASSVALHAGLPATDLFSVCSPDLKRRAHDLSGATDISLVEFGQVAPCRPPLRPSVIVLYDLIWRKHLLQVRFRESQRRGWRAGFETQRLRAEARIMELLETAWYARYDAVVVTSEHDRALLVDSWERQGIRNPPVFVSPNGIAFESFSQVPPVSETGAVGFAGGLDHPPNRDGLELLVTSILPRIGRPLKRIIVAGPHTESISFERVQGLGSLEDIRTLYQQCTITVAPIRWGSGTRIKILESLATARPVVAFPHAAEGLEDLARSGALLIAHDEREFALLAEDLLMHPEKASAIGKAGREAVKSYDWNVTLKHLDRALTCAARGRGGHCPQDTNSP